MPYFTYSLLIFHFHFIPSFLEVPFSHAFTFILFICSAFFLPPLFQTSIFISFPVFCAVSLILFSSCKRSSPYIPYILYSLIRVFNVAWFLSPLFSTDYFESLLYPLPLYFISVSSGSSISSPSSHPHNPLSVKLMMIVTKPYYRGKAGLKRF